MTQNMSFLRRQESIDEIMYAYEYNLREINKQSRALTEPGKIVIRILAETAALSLDMNKVVKFLESLRAVGAGSKPAPTTGKINITTGLLFSQSEDTRDIAIKLASCKAFDCNDVQPFPAEIAYEQKRLQGKAAGSSPLYDGFKLANFFREILELSSINTVTFVYTDRLIGSRDEGGRWHARTVIFSHPSIVSIPGIVHAPARSRKYYIAKQLYHSQLAWESASMDSCLRRNDINGSSNNILDDDDYVSENDPRIEEVVNSYTLQAFYYSVFGNPFCGDNSCRLFNSHWQKEMIQAQINGNICKIHKEVLKEWLNIRLSA